MKEYRCNRNKTDRGLEDKVNSLLHKFDIKHGFFGGKLNGANCWRLMTHHIDIIDDIKDIFIETNEGIVSDEEICLVTNELKTLLIEMDEGYCCIRLLIVYDNLIFNWHFCMI